MEEYYQLPTKIFRVSLNSPASWANKSCLYILFANVNTLGRFPQHGSPFHSLEPFSAKHLSYFWKVTFTSQGKRQVTQKCPFLFSHCPS